MKKFLLLIIGLLNTFLVFSQVSLGDGGNTSFLPINAYYTYTYSQTIYSANSINASGDIDSICYKTRAGINLSSSNEWVVLIGHTTFSDLSGGWVDANTLDTVFDGTVAITNDTVYIPFNQAFTYNGTDNIVIAILENKPGLNGFNDKFYSTSTTGDVSRRINGDSYAYDPYTLTQSGSTFSAYPDIAFFGITQTCPAPISLNVDSLAYNAAIIGWTGNTDDYQVDFALEGDALGQGSITSTTAESIFTDTLTGSTNYRVYVREICGVGDTSLWSGPYSFTTPCSPFTPAYLQDFAVFEPECWERKRGVLSDSTTFEDGVLGAWWSLDGFANVGFTGAIRATLSASLDDWLISPTIDLGDGSTVYALSFDAALTKYFYNQADVFDADDSVYVVISTDNGVTWSDNNVLQEWNQGTSLSHNGEFFILDLTGYTGLVKFAFYAHSSSSVSGMFHLDNFLVDVMPACLQPLSLTVSDITDAEATLSWIGSETSYFVEYGEAGFTQGTGTTLTVNDTTLALSALSAATDYEFYVSTNCVSIGDTSLWSGPYSFTTPCVTLTVPTAVEPFDAVTPTCWEEAKGLISDSTTLTSLGTSNWSSQTFGNQSGGSSSAHFNIYSTTEGWLISPSIDLGGGGQYQLEFDMVATSWGSTNPPNVGNDDTVRVVISTDNGITWSRQNTLEVWNTTTGLPNSSTHKTYDLSAYSGVVKFAFYSETTQFGTNWQVFFDNFEVTKCLQTATINDTVCTSYTSPAGNIYTQTGTYTDTLIAACDSIFTINLVVNNSTTSSVSVEECDTFVSVTGNIYTQTGVYYDTIPNANTCDSIIETNLSIIDIDLSLSQTQNVLESNETDPSATYQWVDCSGSNLTPVGGATSAQFTATVESNYACQITLNNCTKLSECISSGPISVAQFDKYIIEVYPNPNNGQFTIKLSDKPQEELMLAISNTLGQVIYQQKVTTPVMAVDLNGAGKGVYIMELFSPTQSSKSRIVVE